MSKKKSSKKKSSKNDLLDDSEVETVLEEAALEVEQPSEDLEKSEEKKSVQNKNKLHPKFHKFIK